MIFWTDNNTRESPTTYDMDGEGTPLRQGDIMILHEHTLHCEGLVVVRPEDYQILLTPDMDAEVLLSFIADEGINCGANWKFEAAGPPPSWREDFRSSNLARVLRESGISLNNARIGPIGGIGWTDVNTQVNAKFTNMDGLGTSYADSDTINCATHNLTVDASHTTGAITLTAGTLTFNTTQVVMQAGNLLIGGATSVTGTITPGTYTDTFNGAVTVNSGGVLGGNTAWTCDCNADMTISSGGVVSAPNGSGACTFSGTTFTVDGTYTANSGTFTVDKNANSKVTSTSHTSTATTFYNLTSVTTSGGYLLFYDNTITVQNTFTINLNAAALLQVSTKLVIGTVTGAGSIVSTASAGSFGTLDNNSANTTVQAASASYIASCTGNSWAYGAAGICSLKWLDLQFDQTTGGSMATINFTGDMMIHRWSTTAKDTTSCTVAGTTFTAPIIGNMFDISGTLNLQGTAGNNITLNNIGPSLNSLCTCTLSYVTLALGECEYMIFNGGQAITHTLDNLTLIGGIVDKLGRLRTNNTNTVITITNSTITGLSGLYWNEQQIQMYNNCKMQLSSCTFTTLGMKGPTGWLESVDVSGNYTHYGILASSETPNSGYRGSQCAGIFTIKNADAYSTPFNSSYTLGANMPSVKSVSILASTTFNISTYTVKVNSRDGSNVSWNNLGTLTCGTGLVQFVGVSAANTFDILGDNTWYDLQISIPSQSKYRFETAKTQIITHNITLGGVAGNLLVLDSSTGAAKWNLTVQTGKSQSVNFVDARYSDASLGDTIVASHSNNSGNNMNWNFLIGGWGGSGGNGENGGGNNKPQPQPGPDQNAEPARSYNIDEEMLKQNEQEYLDWVKRHPPPTYYSSYGWVTEIPIPIRKKWKKLKLILNKKK